MVDITVTAASVVKGANGLTKLGTAGATITAGQVLYLDSTTGTLKLADNNLSAAAATPVGIALNGGASGQPIEYLYEDDDFTPGATLTQGLLYVLSGTAGGIAPSADLTSGMYPSLLFIAKSAAKGVMKLVRGGAVV